MTSDLTGVVVLRVGDGYAVGRGLVDAMMARCKVASHGTIRIGQGDAHKWQSTMPIGETERALRAAARHEGVRVTLLTSQAT